MPRPLVRIRAAAFFAVALCAAGCHDALPAHFITDAQGRVLILHGANVSGSAKGHPQRLPWVDADDVARLARDFGFNFARYLIFWDAVEPQPGVIDTAYLDAVAERLDWFQAAGIHVVIDMHQDVYSRVFCCDGAPPWAIDDDGEPFTPAPLWWLNYFSPAVVAAFENFFNVRGQGLWLQDHYGDAWAAVAERFRDHPAVLGYDLMNEPSPSSALSQETPPDGSMAAFDRNYLTPFYQRMIDRIREVDSDGWIFYEPVFLVPAMGGRSYVGPLHDPRSGESRIAYFPHLYSTQVEAFQRYDPAGDSTIPNWRASRLIEAEETQKPVLIGEFGITDSVQNGLAHLQDVLAMADRTTSGWAYWEYNSDAFGFLRSDGTEKPKAAVLVRSYPQRVAGRPLHIRYDPATRVLELIFAETGVPGPTEIYVPEGRYYPEGFDLLVSDAAGTWQSAWDPDREVLSLWTDPSRPNHAVVVRPRD
jgi:endoglycosylceramidase